MADDNDPVGYGRPPKRSQFKPGRSGNPKGRPKRSRNITTEISAELDIKISVREGDRELKLTKAQALAKLIVARALKGEMKAVTLLMTLLPQRFAIVENPDEVAAVSSDEAAVLERFLNRKFAERLAKGPGDPIPTMPNASDREEQQ